MEPIHWLIFALAMFLMGAVCLKEAADQFRRMLELKRELGYIPATVFVVVIFGFGAAAFFGVGVWAIAGAFM